MKTADNEDYEEKYRLLMEELGIKFVKNEKCTEIFSIDKSNEMGLNNCKKYLVLLFVNIQFMLIMYSLKLRSSLITLPFSIQII
jgi:hypothetical protein